MLNTTKAESNDVGSQDCFPRSSQNIAHATRKDSAAATDAGDDEEGMVWVHNKSTRGDVGRRDDRNFRVARNYSGSFISPSDIRFFEDRSFKHASVGFREWVVAGSVRFAIFNQYNELELAQIISASKHSRRLHGIEWALLFFTYCAPRGRAALRKCRRLPSVAAQRSRAPMLLKLSCLETRLGNVEMVVEGKKGMNQMRLRQGIRQKVVVQQGHRFPPVLLGREGGRPVRGSSPTGPSVWKVVVLEGVISRRSSRSESGRPAGGSSPAGLSV
ncbi:hypothetical protein R3P38DRAFT_2803928 [Favolaschia claudopus]|uniref:Uncharacterized protein n=1 Tax=Favolaschia claudopus TaxID=2862362 RepID=A0AAV9ZS42_9AGAR